MDWQELFLRAASAKCLGSKSILCGLFSQCPGQMWTVFLMFHFGRRLKPCIAVAAGTYKFYDARTQSPPMNINGFSKLFLK